MVELGDIIGGETRGRQNEADITRGRPDGIATQDIEIARMVYQRLAMQIETFELERNQSLYENTVKYNLTESGIHPYTLRELLSEEQQQQVLDLRLGYGQTNGDPYLRRTLAALYPGCTRTISLSPTVRRRRISWLSGACWSRVTRWP